MKTRIGTALLVGALSLYLSPGLAAAEEAHSLEQLAIESASTPAQHEALAKHFEHKAADARERAAEHMSMGKTYGANKKLTEAVRMREHCEKLAKSFEEQAKAYDSLAAAHHKQAGM